MPSKDDGTFDGLDAFRRAFEEEGAQPSPPEHAGHSHWKQVALLAIDEFTGPTMWCPNGHIVQWCVDKGKPEEMFVTTVARYPREILMTPPQLRDASFKATPVCGVCGEDGVDAEGQESHKGYE